MRIDELKTPCFIFDERILSNRMENLLQLKKSLAKEADSKINLCYAIKANSFIIKCMDKYVHAFEVCSWGELDICKKTGIDLSKVVLSGVNKEEEYVADGISSGVGIITAESALHYEYICRQAKLQNKQVKTILRLSNGAQFGMDASVFEEIIANRNSNSNVEIIGIHYFTGTAKKKIEKLKKEIDKIEEFVNLLDKKYGWKPQLFEYGPGLTVPYFTDDNFENQFSLFEELVSYLVEKDFSYDTTLEMGRFFSASIGSYITKVADVKFNDGVNVCIIDGGKNQLSYYGQNMALKTPIIEKLGSGKTNNQLSADTTKWMIFGSLCSFNDIIARDVPIEDLKVGDKLIFKEVGAYSITEGIALFLSRRLPSVYSVGQDGEYKLVRDEIESSQFNF